MGGFLDDAPKAENGFVFMRIVSSAAANEIILGKYQSFQTGLAAGQSGPPSSRSEAGNHDARAVTPRCERFTRILRLSAERSGKRGLDPQSNRQRFGSDPSHQNRDARIIGRVHVRDGHHDGGKSRSAARCGSTEGPQGSTTYSRQRRRNGAAIEPGPRGRTADVRAADRFAPREAA